MPRPIAAQISRSALSRNLDVVRARLDAARNDGSPARIWAVVKANAYGHGLERALSGLGAADGIAILDLADAARARQAGWAGPIMLIEGLFEPADLDALASHSEPDEMLASLIELKLVDEGGHYVERFAGFLPRYQRALEWGLTQPAERLNYCKQTLFTGSILTAIQQCARCLLIGSG